MIQLKKDNQRKVKNQLVQEKARAVEISSADINNVETNPSKRMRFHGKKNWNKNLLLSPNPNWKSREHSKFGHVMVSPHFRYQPKKPNNAPLNYQPHSSRDHSSHDHQSHDMRHNASSASNFPTHFTRNYNNKQSHDPVSRDLVSRDPVHSVTNATHSEESHDYWSHDKVQNIVTILSSLKRKLEQSRGTSRNSFPLNYQPLQSHDQSHDQSCDMGRADVPNPMPMISKHDQSSDHNSSMMTVYEDGSKKFWDKGITLLDYGEPAARAGSIGSNVINDMKTPLVRGREEIHPHINHQQNSPAVSLELPHPSAPGATIFTDFCDSPSPFPPPPPPPPSGSNIFTIRPNQVKTSIAPFSAAPPLFSITPMTKVTKPSTESPVKLFTVPQTITSSHGLAHNNPSPAATAKSSEKSTTNRYSVSQSRYSGAFSNSASKYMAPKVSVGSALVKPLQANKQGQQFKATNLVPFSNNQTKIESTMAVSNPLLANRHNATNPTIMSSPSPAITLTASGTVTPLFYRSQKKEGMSVNSSTSCFTINRLATTQTQFKLSHL